jgi:hypothetical protein
MRKLFLFVLFAGIFSGSLFAQNADFSTTQGIQIDAKVPHFVENTALTTATWSTLTASPHAVSRSCCAYVRRNDTGYVFQFGGGSGAQYTNVARYNVVTATWTNSVSVIPSSISAGSSLAYGDSVIFVIGGESVGGLGKTLKWNFVTNIWTTLAPVTPNPMTDAFCYRYHDSLIYVIGGGDGLFGTTTFADVRVYNIRTNTYSAGTPLPTAKSMMGGAIYGDTIIVGSGWGAGGVSTAVCNKGVINPANPTSITWTTIPNYPSLDVTRPASFLVIVGQGVGVMFTGGAVAGATLTAATNLWNFCTQTWQTLPANTLARSNYKGSGAADSVVYCVGGFTTVGVGQFDKISFSLIDGTCGILGINQNGNEIPGGYSLAQNYPNPFNPSTMINFSLPKAGNVKLVVSDVLGREVAVLYNGYKTAGVHAVDFDASKLSSGIYFYSITAGNFKDTKKMLLIK